MSVVAESIGSKRSRAPAKGKRLPQAYVALHSTQLSRCLANGLLFVPGGAPLAPIAAPVPAAVLEEARQGLGYGSVVLVEFAPRPAGLDHDQGGTESAVAQYREAPLAWVPRAVFRSRAEMDEFLARASSYDDVPIDALEYGIDASLFGTGGLLDTLATPRGAAQEDVAAARTGAEIGRIAGAIAAVLAGARWGGVTAKQVDDLHAAFTAAPIDGSPMSLIEALATAIDGHPGSQHGIALTAVAATILSGPGAASGFDVDAFLAELCRQALLGGIDAEVVAKFETRAGAVLSGATELRDNAFADAEGKVPLRALLLFMLNPEIEALRKIRARMADIGQGVFLLACALAGCHGGIARCNVSTKAPGRAVFLGTTMLAWRIHARQPVALAMDAGWTPAGTYESALGVAGFRLATSALPAPATLILLKSALAGMGIDSAFETASGALAWHDDAGKGRNFFAYASKSPSLPSVDAVDICIHFDQKALARGAARAWTEASTATRESGVFARQSARGKLKGVELRVACLAAAISPMLIRSAAEVLLRQAEVMQTNSSSA
ncbi:MAG: hypothetical protein JWR07_1427 [Nevskia sp.]|nr:hypothetical protein [Nevskia sp.]